LFIFFCHWLSKCIQKYFALIDKNKIWFYCSLTYIVDVNILNYFSLFGLIFQTMCLKRC
jgi:hypothetical protein